MTITAERNGARFSLYATSHGFKSVVGPRILRGSGDLDVDVHHDTLAEAETAAAKLRAYLASFKPAKKKRSTAMGAFEE
jgi:hypothetical protein